MKIYAVVEPRVLDFGPTVYVGELRAEDDKPIREHLNGTTSHLISPVAVGPTEAEVFEALQNRARAIFRGPRLVILKGKV